MNKHVAAKTVWIAVTVLSAGVFLSAVAWADDAEHADQMSATAPAPDPAAAGPDVAQALDAVNEAIKAEQASDARNEQVLKALQQAKAHLESALKQFGPVKVANKHCPIMGSELPAKGVAAELTRQYNGKTIGFCCGGCPAAWDKLSDEQKDAKLQAAD